MTFDFSSTRWPIIPFLFCLALSSCEKRSGEAVVLSKECIPIAEVSPTPGEQPSSSEVGVEAEPSSSSLPDEEVASENEGPDLRGTSKDPRAVDHEQWIATVRMVSDRRVVEVRVGEQRWSALKEGERVKVRYKVGKYTGTIWSSELE